MIKIHDIKPIVEIPDYSIYLYYILLFLGVVFIATILYFLYSYFKPKEKSQDFLNFEILKKIDFENIKQTAYDIPKYGRLLAKDERQKRIINELADELSLYKYKKEIPREITQEIKTKFTIFMESIDVR